MGCETEPKGSQSRRDNPTSSLSHLTSTHDIHFREGLISSHQFGDSYFSHIDGYRETQHVFLGGNGLPGRFNDKTRFTIAELGFGTGLNFLTTLQAWRAEIEDMRCEILDVGQGLRPLSFEAIIPHLTYVGFELFPLEADIMREALARWPEIADLQEELIAALPPLEAGIHTVNLPNVQLILVYGDANTWLPKWDTYCASPVDAWYLDGFAPKRNSELWNEALMADVYRVTQTGGTGATYTSAGFVRRMLEDVGFEVTKVSGFANKREMTTLIKE